MDTITPEHILHPDSFQEIGMDLQFLLMINQFGINIDHNFTLSQIVKLTRFDRTSVSILLEEMKVTGWIAKKFSHDTESYPFTYCITENGLRAYLKACSSTMRIEGEHIVFEVEAEDFCRSIQEELPDMSNFFKRQAD